MNEIAPTLNPTLGAAQFPPPPFSERRDGWEREGDLYYDRDRERDRMFGRERVYDDRERGLYDEFETYHDRNRSEAGYSRGNERELDRSYDYYNSLPPSQPPPRYGPGASWGDRENERDWDRDRDRDYRRY